MDLAAHVKPVDRVTLGKRVYQDLREILMSGQAAPGDRMSLRGLAAALGVSAMPVREAVTRLVAEQALEVMPNRLIRVPVMTRARFEELRTIRLELEGLAAEIAATRRTAEELAYIRACHDKFLDECRQPQPDGAAVVRANKEFHFGVYRAAHMPALLQIIEGLWLQIGPVLNLDLRSSNRRLRELAAHEHHALVLDALERGDGRTARAALAADIRDAGDFILSLDRLPS